MSGPKAHVWPEEQGLDLSGEPIPQPLEATRRVTRAQVDQLRCAATEHRVTLRAVLGKHFDSRDPFALPECEFHAAMEVIRNGG